MGFAGRERSLLSWLVMAAMVSSVSTSSVSALSSKLAPCELEVRAEWGDSGSLSSPGYPSSYPSYTSCTWIVNFSDDLTLSIKLMDIDIEEDAICHNPPCCTRNWLKYSSKQLCGHGLKVPNFIAEKKRAIIKFHTSKVIKGGHGFFIAYIACKKDQFHCADCLSCIEQSQRCDGIFHCIDGSDEWHCREKKLIECAGDNMIPCGGADKICFNNVTERCNGNVDCPSTANDETNCLLCGPNSLHCKSGGCYPSYGACDDIVHCAGGWDEGLRGGCGVCTKDYVPCGFHDPCHCFHAHRQRCDGQMDCPGGEDETSCVTGCENKIACANVQGCYSPSERCDGVPQCLDNSDEVGCQAFPVKFRCITTSRCVDDYMVCNGEDDCGDGSDESDCIKNSVIIVVIMGSLICGLLAVFGAAIGWRYYSSRSRMNILGNQNHYQRQENIEPLDDSSLYHLYREPPPSYQEAIMQGASPPVYCYPTRFASITDHSEATPPVAAPRRQRPRSSAMRPRSSRLIPKPNQIAKPATEAYTSNASESEVIVGDQLYPENGTLSDSDTPMLELSDNNTGASSTDNFASDSSTSSPSGTSCPNLMLPESNNGYQPT